jgi:hypothetical protein
VYRGYVVYLVHIEEDKPGRPPRRTLYPFINTHSAGATPRKGYTAEELSRAYPEFAKGTFLSRASPKFVNEVRSTPERDIGQQRENYHRDSSEERRTAAPKDHQRDPSSRARRGKG